MKRRRHAALILALALLAPGLWLALGNRGKSTIGAPGPAGGPGSGIFFADVTARAGIRFRHENGAEGKWFIAEPMGSGGGFFDHDGDGDMDIYLVNSGKLGGPPDPNPSRNALYRNDGGGSFTEVTEASGTGDDGYGMGCAMADYDNDGDVDIYVTNLGPNVLYRNRGDGTFEDVAEAAGVGNRSFGSSCLFADADADGHLDLYVVNYVVLSLSDEKMCGKPGLRTYCHPSDYDAAPDVFYHNQGDGTFADWTRKAGLYRDDGKGLGVVASDFDGDRDIDIYVANDTSPNFYFRNDGEGVFQEVGQILGVAYGEGGLPEAGMGVAAGDYDGDGWMDLIVTNYAQETNSIYWNSRGEYFENRIVTSGLAGASLVPLGFGTGFFDLDLDGRLDLAVMNGHIEVNISSFYDYQSYPQSNQLFRNRGDGSLEDVSSGAGPGFTERRVSRGLACADFDLDGDLDLLVTNCDDGPQLLENRTQPLGGWVAFLPLTGDPPRVAIGARLRLETADGAQVRDAISGGSYLSQSEPWVHFGLGKAKGIDVLEVRWPSGKSQRFEGISAGRRYRVVEGKDAPEAVAPR